MKLDTSGINLVASDAEMDDLATQVDDSILFLEQHFAQLQTLIHVSGVEDAVLSFGLDWRQDALVQVDHIPTKLVQIAGQLGLAIDFMHYHVSNAENSAQSVGSSAPPARS